MNVQKLIEDLQKYFKPEDEVYLSIKLDTDLYKESSLRQVYRDEDKDFPILSNEDDDGKFQ